MGGGWQEMGKTPRKLAGRVLGAIDSLYIKEKETREREDGNGGYLDSRKVQPLSRTFSVS